MKKSYLVCFLLAVMNAGCGRPTYDHGSNNSKCVSSAMRHTGIVTVMDISVGYCLRNEKSGTPVCDRTIVYRTDQGRIQTIGLARSGQWPLVWKNAHGDIWFWISKGVLDCEDQGAIITEFDEIQRQEPK